MKNNQKMIGNLLLTLTALIWGTAFVFQRKGMESIEPITFTSARMALAAVAVGIAAFIITKKTVSKSDPAKSKKISAESEKISAESEKIFAESKEISAESEKISAKSKEISAESGKISAETEKTSAGSAKIPSGSAKIPSESAKISSETGTKTSKSERAFSETERKTRRKNTVLGGICCGSFLACASIFQQMGIVYTTAGKAGFITAMYMIIVPVIGFVLFKKRNTWLVWLAVLIGVAGMYLLCMTEGFTLTRGDTLVCICAVLFSGHILCCDYFVQRGEAIWISAIQFVTCSALSAVAACILENPTWEKVFSASIPILYCGILSGGVGYTLQIIAQKFTDPTIASLLMSLESVFAVLAGAILLGEHMTLREMAGCVVMFLIPSAENQFDEQNTG